MAGNLHSGILIHSFIHSFQSFLRLIDIKKDVTISLDQVHVSN